jgi:creatinine amidohydrolase/Fe(II)-dependent formamide hydrolase-like protein
MTYSPAPTGSPHRIKQMRPGEVADAIQRDPRLIIPVGACEQHGRHMPLG